MVSEDKWSEISFSNEEWIRAFGLGPHNALDYFALSPFYDTSCNNEVVKMQGLSLEHLDKMTGLEYRLLYSGKEPLLFIVVKQIRVSPSSQRVKEMFYILDKQIYSSPNLHRLILSRVTKSCVLVQNAFDRLNQAAHFSPHQGFTWRFEDDKLGFWHSNAIHKSYEKRFKRRNEQLENYGRVEMRKLLRKLQEDVPKLNGKSKDV